MACVDNTTNRMRPACPRESDFLSEAHTRMKHPFHPVRYLPVEIRRSPGALRRRPHALSVWEVRIDEGSRPSPFRNLSTHSVTGRGIFWDICSYGLAARKHMRRKKKEKK